MQKRAIGHCEWNICPIFQKCVQGMVGYLAMIIKNLLLSLWLKEFWKSVSIWRSYRQESNGICFDSLWPVVFFMSPCVYWQEFNWSCPGRSPLHCHNHWATGASYDWDWVVICSHYLVTLVIKIIAVIIWIAWTSCISMLWQWQTWPELFGIMPNAATKSYVISYLMYVVWALMFALFAAVLVKLFAPYACGSGISEVSYISQ